MATPRRIRNQAKDLAFVRYGPELSALTALLKEAQQTRTDTIRSGRSAAASIQSGVDMARPDVRNVYTAAQRTANAANRIAAPSLAALPAGNPFSAAAAIEQSGLKGRLAESKASTLAELSDRRVDAAAGAAGQARQANTQYTRTSGQLGQRRLDIGREAGSFITSTIRDLTDANATAKADAAKLASQLTNSRGNAWISAGVDPTTGKAIPGGRLDPNAPQNQPKVTKPSKPTGADRGASADFSKADQWIKRLDNAELRKHTGSNRKAARSAIAENLLLGNRDAGIPAIPRAILSAALDMHFDKALDPNTVRLLHQLGYKVKRLPGVVTARQRDRNRPPFRPRVVTAPGYHGQQRPT
jgi:hypothetical protein